MGEKKVHLLVVDDEEGIRKTLSNHFRLLDYHVDTAEDGREALEILRQKRMEVVITDIMMPRMNGLELLKEIRDNFPMVHSIVLTGYATLNNLLQALRYRADTCIFKPIEDLSELEDAVSNAVLQLRNWQKKLKYIQDMKE